jgi:N-acetylmuramoyl-L-alanine amidase
VNGHATMAGTEAALGPSTLASDALLSLESLVAERSAHAQPLDAEVECMAKVVYHEAANQPLAGQLAVAQLILNRMKSGRFPKTPCTVVNQPGQFFQTARYSVAASKRWSTAVAISLLAAEERLGQVVPGALFFHAASAHPSAMVQRRVRVARIGDQIFYR